MAISRTLAGHLPIGRRLRIFVSTRHRTILVPWGRRRSRSAKVRRRTWQRRLRNTHLIGDTLCCANRKGW